MIYPAAPFYLKIFLCRGAWLAQSVDQGTLDLEVIISSSMLDIEITFLKIKLRGPWVVLPVRGPTLTQVMISRFMSSSSALGSVLTAQSLELASGSVSPSLSAPPRSASTEFKIKD